MREFLILLTAFALALALASCSNSIEDNPLFTPLQWSPMPDGSQVAVDNSDRYLNTGPGSIVRCWKTGSSFDCLAAKAEERISGIRFRRLTLDALPPAFIDALPYGEGYDCSVNRVYGTAYVEQISTANGPIKSNNVSDANRRVAPGWGWTRAEVETTMRENGVNAAKGQWLSCRALADKILDTSLATIQSTEITQAFLDAAPA